MVDVVVATYNETQNAYQATSYLVSPGTEYALSIGSNLSAYDFAGWVVVPDLSSLGRVPILLSDEDLLPSYHRMKVEDKTVVVAACYKTTSLTLANDEPNEPLLSKSLYNIYDVSLNDRMLYRNGDWNTLCLPFELKDFIGTFSPVTIGKEGENTLLYLGADKTLYWPNREIIIGCQRAYIQLNGITAGDLAETRLNFGDGETTEMTTTRFANDTNPDGAWYDLSGRRLSGKPSRAGVYINNSTAKGQGNNAKKIVIK